MLKFFRDVPACGHCHLLPPLPIPFTPINRKAVLHAKTVVRSRNGIHILTNQSEIITFNQTRKRSHYKATLKLDVLKLFH